MKAYEVIIRIFPVGIIIGAILDIAHVEYGKELWVGSLTPAGHRPNIVHPRTEEKNHIVSSAFTYDR